MLSPKKTVWITTGIALLFHAIGFIGILWKGVDFAATTPFHLVLMLLMLAIAQPSGRQLFFVGAMLVGAASFLAEWIGVHTGILFGNYTYGTTLGVKFQEVPLLIAANWVLLICGIASLVQPFLKRGWKHYLVIAFLIALLATSFDWLMEPVAIKLGYWHWQHSYIPLRNYVCWFLLSFLCGLLWLFLKVPRNQSGINLFLIQCLFFLLLRLFL